MSTLLQDSKMKVSKLAENIIGSEIIKLAGEVNEKIKQGEKIYNMTIGDFNPKMINLAHNLEAEEVRRLSTYRYLFDRDKAFVRHPILS